MKRLVLALACAPLATAAQEARETVVVSATRLPQAGFDVPAAIDAIGPRTLREDNPQVNLSETLNRVPGIVVQNRQNYAQDLQISSRGFGARSTFGVRGVRLIADGIPATMPDGQGQAATFDLASAARIEVLRGPFASLYGNASGGVVSVFTADGPERPTLDIGFGAGSYGQHRENVRFGGMFGAANILGNASRFHTDGYREHSRADRDQLNVKAKGDLGGGTVTLVFNLLEQPETQDPLGLTRAQFAANPRQVDPSAIQFNTRKTIQQGQGGVVWSVPLSPLDTLEARAYTGNRTVVQFLGQAGDTPLGAGGVVDLDRSYGGLGLRWTRKQGAFSLVAGADVDRLDERRRGYVNNNGVAGALRRDEDDAVVNSDAFAQLGWDVARWTFSAGVRSSRVRFSSADYYVTAQNPDDSGGRDFRRTIPVAGLLFRATDRIHVYANAGQGFETPTFAEMAYRAGGVSGLNFDLKPARSTQYEAGVKARLAFGLRVNADVFHIDTRDEIVTNGASGGRTDFKNASRTRRDGAELALEWPLPAGFEASLAYTVLRARFTDPFTSSGVPVASGARLPGVPDRFAQAELAWRAGGFHAAIEGRHAGRVFVNEANADAAEAYSVANVRAGYEWLGRDWRVTAYARADNVSDRRYAGSVIVAEARGRFFEPAPGRNYYGGVEISRGF